MDKYPILFDRKERCTGCTACANICPQNAITMQPDEEGFLYPVIDKELCINCKLCYNICPVRKSHEIVPFQIKSYVIRTKDNNVLSDSTSGGFVTPLIQWIFEQNGIVCAVTYDKDFHIIHRIFEKDDMSSEEYSKIRGSKYVQSRLDDCFVKIKDNLEKKKSVCFIGTPCQVNGLKAFLKKDYDNLLTVDLVCHGTPSPKLWDKYLKFQKEKNQSKIQAIYFRDKTYGYHSGAMKIEFENEKSYKGSARVDYMLKSFFKEISSRPSCYECPYKTLERCSDFTIYDCWHASELVPSLKDDDKGYTNLIVQSEKGEKVLEEISNRYELYSADTEKAVQLDGVMVLNSAKPHVKRADYYKDFETDTLPEHINKFLPISTLDHIIERCKIVIYRLGIYRILQALLRK